MNEESNIFIGIDVSKQTLDISIKGNHSKIANTVSAISDFIKSEIAETAIKPKLCVLEATGGYELLVMNMLQQAGISVHRAHPNKVYAFAKASEQSAKTDKLDALMLEQYAEFVHKRKHGDPMISKAQQELQELRLVERSLEEEMQAHNCRVQHLSGQAKKHLERHMKFIAKELVEIRNSIKQLIKSDSELCRKNSILISCIGVGPKTASIVMAELPELGTFSKKEVASMVGVAPCTKESGKKVFKAHINGGRFYVRKALYMSALVAVQRDTKMRAVYDRLIAAGKAAKVALVAIIRKIIICLNQMIKHNQMYKIS